MARLFRSSFAIFLSFSFDVSTVSFVICISSFFSFQCLDCFVHHLHFSLLISMSRLFHSWFAFLSSHPFDVSAGLLFMISFPACLFILILILQYFFPFQALQQPAAGGFYILTFKNIKRFVPRVYTCSIETFSLCCRAYIHFNLTKTKNTIVHATVNGMKITFCFGQNNHFLI